MAWHELVKDTLIPDDTVLIHGTSIEATLDMIEHGMLRSGAFPKGNYGHPDYLYFIPYKNNMAGHPLYGSCEDFSWGTSLHNAAVWASIVGFRHALSTWLDGAIDVETIVDLDSEEIGTLAPALGLLGQELQKKGYDTNPIEMVNEAKKRQGVLLGIGREAFELPLEPGKFDPADICVHLPGALPMKYVNGIAPRGAYEKQQLERYLGTTSSPSCIS